MPQAQLKKVKRILVVTLSNIGDVAMSLPVMDTLKRDFPKAKISIVVGPRAAALFKGNTQLDKVHVYDKKQRPLQLLRWIIDLRKCNYDMIVDLKNTMIPFLASRRFVTSPFLRRFKNKHMCVQHLYRLRSLYAYGEEPAPRVILHINDQDRLAARNLLYEEMESIKPFIVVVPGAANAGKCWPAARFAGLADNLISKSKLPVVLIGSDSDYETAESIRDRMKQRAINLCGKTTLTQVVEVLQKSCLVIANDSGLMHLSSYLNVPTLALFGPSNPVQSGPWSNSSAIVIRNQRCFACQKEDRRSVHSCLAAIKVEDVLSCLDVGEECVVLK